MSLYWNNSALGKPVVVDIGSAMTKCGYSNTLEPKKIFPTAVGYLNNIYPSDLNEESSSIPYYIGEDLFQKKKIKKVIYPIQNYTNIDWEYLEKIIHHVFYYFLETNPNYHPTFIVEPLFSSPDYQSKMAEALFEVFCVPAIYFKKAPFLALYASNKTTGLIIDSGANNTHIIPIYKGFIISHAITHSEVGGNAITTYLQRLLSVENKELKYESMRPLVNQIKEELCYISLNYAKEKKVYQASNKFNKSFILPSGEIAEIGIERIMAPELLFNPQLNGIPSDPIHSLILESIERCDVDMRSELLSNIILTGGNTLFLGFKERLYKELLSSVANKNSVNIITTNKRAFLPWLGGSMFSSLNSFPSMWLSRHEYSEGGLDTKVF